MDIPRPFDQRQYSAKDLPYLDRLHERYGLGAGWMNSEERLKIAMRDVKIPSSRRDRRKAARKKDSK